MQLDPKTVARIIRNFISDPLASGPFADCYEQCFHFARAYIPHLHFGPLADLREAFATDQTISSIATSLLGKIFENTDRKRPFIRFHKKFKPLIAQDISDEKLTGEFIGFLSRQLRQEIQRIINEGQSGNIRRALKGALNGGEYESISIRKISYWAWRNRKDGFRQDRPMITRDECDHIVIEAANKEKSTMPDRCRYVFTALDQDDRFQNFLGWNRLLGAFRDFIGSDVGGAPQPSVSPPLEYLHRMLRLLSGAVVEEITTNELRQLAEKKGMHSEIVDAYRVALRNFMEDFVMGDHDPLPQYLKEELPDGDADYLKDHKYAWETLVQAAVESLRQKLRDRGLEPPQNSGDK